MKVSLFVFLAGLCLGPLVAELTSEDACVAENCAAKAATGPSLMQKVSTENKESGLNEDNIADAAVDVETETEEADSVFDVDEEAEYDKPRGPKPLKACDKLPKKSVQRRVDGIKKRIASAPGRFKKCETRLTARIEKLKKAIEHFEKCIGKYGSFVEDGVSEMAEDGADDPETLDELIETGAEELEFEEEYVDKLFEDLDEAEEDAAVEDAATEDAETAETEDVDKSELIDVDKPKPLPTCDKIPKEKVEKIIAHLKKILPKVSKDMCKKKLDDYMERLKKMLDHFTKCL